MLVKQSVFLDMGVRISSISMYHIAFLDMGNTALGGAFNASNVVLNSMLHQSACQHQQHNAIIVTIVCINKVNNGSNIINTLFAYLS